MGDLAVDTAVEGSQGRYTAQVSPEWEVWGPAGGYIAAIALRAAGAFTDLGRPASLQGHFLGVAAFEAVEITVTSQRRTKRAESIRVDITQDGQPIFTAQVWAVGHLDGLEFAATPPHDPPEPEGLPDFAARLASVGDDGPGHPYWANLDYRPIGWIADWDTAPPGEPVTEGWWQFRPIATFDDPWVDACRGLLLVDMTPWPAVSPPFRGGRVMDYYAPSVDVSATFHTVASDEPWLYAWGSAPLGNDGLIGGRAEVWTRDRRLVASGTATMLCRPAAMRPDNR